MGLQEQRDERTCGAVKDGAGLRSAVFTSECSRMSCHAATVSCVSAWSDKQDASEGRLT